jgi:hypothetical protein
MFGSVGGLKKQQPFAYKDNEKGKIEMEMKVNLFKNRSMIFLIIHLSPFIRVLPH